MNTHDNWLEAPYDMAADEAEKYQAESMTVYELLGNSPAEFVDAYPDDQAGLLRQFIKAAQGNDTGYLTPERLSDRIKAIYEDALKSTVEWTMENK